jgi:hypothetical protein
MAEASLPQDVQQFISQHIRSVEQLEVLCVLAEERGKSCSAQEIFRRIQSTEKSVIHCLDYFVTHRIALKDSHGAFQFAPPVSEPRNCADKLVDLYRKRRVAVIEAIYSKPAGPIQHLPDSLRLRKEK